MKSNCGARKLRHLIIIFTALVLVACNRTGPVQHRYNPNLGCIAANDFYAVYFSAYVEPESKTMTNNEAMLKSHCQNIPKTGTVYFTADLIDEDLRETPIGLQLVERELIEDGDAEVAGYRDIRTISETRPRIYAQGTIETQAYIENDGHYVLYLLIGEEAPLFEDDILKIPFYVGAVTEAASVWHYLLTATKFIMTFVFPIFVLLLIVLPMLPKSGLSIAEKFSSGDQSKTR